MELDPLLLIILALSVIWVSVFHLYKQRNSGHLPPGPPQKFLSGNIHQLPKTEPWKKYAEWAKEYGQHSSLPSILSTSKMTRVSMSRPYLSRPRLQSPYHRIEYVQGRHRPSRITPIHLQREAYYVDVRRTTRS